MSQKKPNVIVFLPINSGGGMPMENLVGRASHREVVDKLRERVIARMVEAGEDVPIIDPPANVPDAGQRRVFEHEILE